MFNMIVKSSAWARGRDTIRADRIFAYTEARLVEQFRPNGQFDFQALGRIPTLFMQESIGQGDEIARVGTITQASLAGNIMTLSYDLDHRLPGIPNQVLRTLAADLMLEDNQFVYTHWSIKDTDLFRVLMRDVPQRRRKPTVFNLQDYESIEPTLVSAMMPFHAGFDQVYDALQIVAREIGFRCRRADDIWENPAVMQDVVSLIDRSRVVIADCTGKNSNVFYEIGIAHTLGREVILTTQNEADIPFDLRHLRYVHYLNTDDGLTALKERLRRRLAEFA